MCLKNATNGKNWLRKYKDKKYITCYKIFEVCNNELYSSVRQLRYGPGVKKSTRINNYLDTFEDDYYYYNKRWYKRWTVNFGIHVYTTKEIAKLKFNVYSKNEIVVPVRCKPEDLIAYSEKDYKQAVFMKVLLEEREYKRALKRFSRK